ncbi:MAG: aldehyde dehydrogenase family protein [Alphaproteobacteria bacterium]|nr:aldehyde dehydrogenase family protein [Alphaproteobacteria bacterium]
MQLPKSFADIFTAADQSVLLEALEAVRFPAGTCIFRAGDPGDGCYLIEQGEVRLELGQSEHVDTERVLGYLTPGWLLGEMALLDNMPRSASAFAETDVLAHRLSTAKSAAIGVAHPRIGVLLYRMLGRDASLKLRKSNERAAEQMAAADDDPEIDRIVASAANGQRAFETWDEPRVDALLLALAQAVAANAGSLAEATVKETRIGNIRDKTIKNMHASLSVYQTLVGRPGVGPVGGDARVVEIAGPAGVVFAIVPITNPVATAIFKVLIALKARCSIILSFHHGCVGVGNAVCELMENVLAHHGAPDGLMQWVRKRTSRAKTAKFMSHDGVSLVLATGGAGMVTVAYRSGTPALGVGPGNAPCYIAADADIEAVAFGIVSSKPYDNGLICGAEHNLVVDDAVRAALIAALERHGTAVLSAGEAEKVAAVAIRPNGGEFAGRIIGQAASTIAEFAGIARPYPIQLIVVPATVDAVEQGSPFAKEKLAPVLSLFTVRGEDEAFALSRRILAGQGAGHTAIIHSRSPERIDRFGLAMPASRIIANGPAVQGVSGVTSGLVPSYVLGCGTWGGNSTTDNVSYRNLQNIKRLAHFVPPVQPSSDVERAAARRNAAPSTF